jgi:hypothetical protein
LAAPFPRLKNVPGDDLPLVGDGPEEGIHSNDHRPLGSYESRYGASAWVQIVAELLILLVYISAALAGVIVSVQLVGQRACRNVCPAATLSGFEWLVRSVLPWSAMFFAALAGGAIFAMKWLYHSVAKAEWNRDRILWRFIAPINSAVLATAAGFGISAGIMPFLDQNSFNNLYAALFFGFFIGHFSDNVLAALQRLARKWFGTQDKTAE